MEGHVAPIDAIDGEALNAVLEDEFRQVFQAEFIHLRILEVNHIWNHAIFGRTPIFLWQNWVPDNLPQDDRRLKDVLLQLEQLLFDVIYIFKSVLRILLEHFYNDLAHIIRYNEILKEIRDLINI